jgi:hypothetical protein
MSLELKIEALTAAVLANTETLAKIIAGGAAPAATTEAVREVADTAEKAPRQRRSRSTEDTAAAPAAPKGVTLDEVKAAANKFLDVSGDDEYDARVKAVFDPIFAKGKCDALGSLPEALYGEVIDAIAAYKPAASRRSI